MNTVRLFNDGWAFGVRPLFYDIDAAANGAWTDVDIPHDWLIEDGDLYKAGEGWYRRVLSLVPQPERRYLLRFEGVYMDSALYVNRRLAFEWKYGYSTFEADLTPFLRPGDNEILLRARYQPPNSRWYSGAGIYRSVWFLDEPETRIASNGVYLSSRRQDGEWRIDIETEIEGARGHLYVEHEVSPYNATGALYECETPVADGFARGSIPMPGALAWDLNAPNLYTLTSVLYADGEPVCAQKHAFGLRETAFSPDQGFLLNGRKVRLNGVCMHHDLGALGAAFHRCAARRQLTLLKEMGVNALRTAHNMPSPELLTLTDEMGILVVDEAFDMWERPKTQYDYARFFDDWYRADVKSWIRRDRNHPSVVMWSIGNEIYDTHADARGQTVTKLLTDEVLKHDPRKNARVTFANNYMPWENAQKCADIVKIVGYNYAEKYYDAHHRAHPDWVIYGSETASIVQSRGVYHFPLSASILADDDLQCSALGNSATSWGARSYEDCIADDANAAYSMGQFVWSGFDYIGEPTPYHTRNSYFGLLDTAGFPKDAYYVFKAAWTPLEQAPMVHLFPHWDWNEGQFIDVRACSNAPRVRLLLNGEIIGEYETGDALHKKLIADARVPYKPGILRAEAYDQNGRLLASDERRSFGDPVRLTLRADKRTLLADGRDMIFLTVGAVDAHARAVENANNRVRVRVTGPARLIGMDNGDSTDSDAYKTDSRRLFSGRLTVMLMAGFETGPITVTAESADLRFASISLCALPCRKPEGVTCRYRVPESAFLNMNTPVRKIELTTADTRALTPEAPEARVFTRMLPANCTKETVNWRVTNDAGVDLEIAKLTSIDGGVAVRAVGDGNFRLRATVNNGGAHPRVLSELEFRANGFGSVKLNPYVFVSAGLYSLHRGEITCGNERGAATAREGESMIGFEHVNFGPDGANTLTLPIFALDDSAHLIELYAGAPGEPCAKIAALTYQKPSIWNVYQSETWKLPVCLRGEMTICFATAGKIHIKGFTFAQAAAQ